MLNWNDTSNPYCYDMSLWFFVGYKSFCTCSC